MTRRRDALETRTDIDHRTEFSDFTETNYRAILRLAHDRYRFARFGDDAIDRHVLWRHDIDTSMNRALRLAEIEAEEGVVTTYFLFPRSLYYNLLNEFTRTSVLKILALGHDVGLHFDPTQHRDPTVGGTLFDAIETERDLVLREFGVAARALSFHLYGVLDEPMPDDDIVCGLVNAYSKRLRENYGYVSDSNGIWRHRRLQNVLEDASEDRLQVLTHPEWWTPEVMAPRARLQRAIDGYAAAMERWYDDTLVRSNRPNLR
jgi:hypothetical protein